MSRRAVLIALVVFQSTTLLSGTAAAFRSENPTPAPSARSVEAEAVHAAVRVAPVPVAPRKVVRTTTAQPVRAPRPKALHKPKAVHKVSHVSVKPAPRLTFSQRVDQAVARIPGYHQGDARWVVVRGQSHWGMTDLQTGVVYLSPRIPSARLYDVVAHEWSHVLSVRVYGGDVTAAVDALNAYYGGSGLSGAERAADCMARQLGARWTHYTPCSDSRWQTGAKRLLAGRRL